MKNTAATKYHYTELYTALRLEMLGTHAAHVLHVLGWEVEDRKRNAAGKADKAAAMLSRMSEEQRDAWATAKIAAAEASKAAATAQLEIDRLEKWAAMTDEQRAEAEAARAEFLANVGSDLDASDIGDESDEDMESEGFVWNETKGHYNS